MISGADQDLGIKAKNDGADKGSRRAAKPPSLWNLPFGGKKRAERTKGKGIPKNAVIGLGIG